MAGCRSLRSRNRKIACKLCIVSFFSCPVCFDGLSRVLVFPPVSSLDIVPLVLPLSPSFPSALALSPPSFSLFPSSSPPCPWLLNSPCVVHFCAAHRQTGRDTRRCQHIYHQSERSRLFFCLGFPCRGAHLKTHHCRLQPAHWASGHSARPKSSS